VSARAVLREDDRVARGRGQRVRRQPQRTCVGCRQPAVKRELLRVVRTPDGDVRVDPTGKAAGRGAYLCRRMSCWLAAKESGALSRALKTDVRPEQIEMIEEYLSQWSDACEPDE